MKSAVAIVGGLGNQLFCLAYALELQANGHNVEILPSISKAHTKQHPQHYSLFSQASGVYFGLPVVGRIGKIPLKSRNAFRAIVEGLGLRGIQLGIETRTEISDTSAPKRGTRLVRGYFQHPDVSEHAIKTLRDGLVPDGGNLPQPNPAEISIHYRRGDYANHKHSLGLLEDEYFIEAAKSARSFTGTSLVRIFSDGNPSQLKIQLQENGFSVKVFQDDNFDPLEILRALASDSGPLIASNSSFSWWAGALSEAGRLVIYPKPWFRDGSLVDMGRKGWTPMAHGWSN